MRGSFYRIVRDLHLYLGLFMSPFVLVFSVSVFYLVHAWLPRLASLPSTTRVVSGLPLPEGWQALSGRPLVEALKPVLAKADLRGEIGFVQHLVKEQKLVIPVTIPGRETILTINTASREGTIVTRTTGFAYALAVLHKSPGQHGPDIRKNWFYIKAWSWMADATAYLIFFIAISGVYLWYVLRSERRIGFILIFAGALSFFGMAYALSH